MEEIIYFEFNNWTCGTDYPDDEPYISWLRNDLNISFLNEKFVIENKLCVNVELIDMSFNFCVTTTKKWTEDNCPTLLTKYKNFLRFQDEDDNCVYGKFGTKFLEYNENNIGIHYVDDEFYDD